MSVSFIYLIHFQSQGYVSNLRLSDFIVYKDWCSHIMGWGVLQLVYSKRQISQTKKPNYLFLTKKESYEN